MSRRRVLLVVNPIAGRNAGRRLLPAARQELADRGLAVQVVETQQSGDAERAARAAAAEMAASEADCVVAAIGGDGTLAEVARGVAASRVPVAAIPAGVGNILARELGIPRDLRAACRLIAEGRPRSIDLVRTDRGAFLTVAGAGFDALVVERFARQRKGPVRKRSYIRPALEILRNARFPRFAVEVDGRVVARRATWAVVGNIRAYGGPFCLTPRARPDDGVLDVCVFRSQRRLAYACYLPGAALRLHLFMPGVSYHRARRVAFHGAAEVPVQLDGDPCGGLPITFEPDPKAVRIIAP